MIQNILTLAAICGLGVIATALALAILTKLLEAFDA